MICYQSRDRTDGPRCNHLLGPQRRRTRNIYTSTASTCSSSSILAHRHRYGTPAMHHRLNSVGRRDGPARHRLWHRLHLQMMRPLACSGGNLWHRRSSVGQAARKGRRCLRSREHHRLHSHLPNYARSSSILCSSQNLVLWQQHSCC